jgi:hypothetical protein
VEGMEGRCLGDIYNGGRIDQSGLWKSISVSWGAWDMRVDAHGFVRDGGHMEGFAHV